MTIPGPFEYFSEKKGPLNEGMMITPFFYLVLGGQVVRPHYGPILLACATLSEALQAVEC